MSRDTHLAVALACHANAVLAGRPAIPFFGVNPVCAGLAQVQFVEPRRDWLRRAKEKVLAATPDDWFWDLARRGATGVRIRQQAGQAEFEQRELAGFPTSSRWTLEVFFHANVAELWAASWTAARTERTARVTYGRYEPRAPARRRTVELEALRGELERALTELAASVPESVSPLRTELAEVLATLRDGELRGEQKELAPPEFLSRTARSLLGACRAEEVLGASILSEAKHRLAPLLTHAIEQAVGTGDPMLGLSRVKGRARSARARS